MNQESRSDAQILRKRWTRDELLILLNLYVKLPFGQFDHPEGFAKLVA